MPFRVKFMNESPRGMEEETSKGNETIYSHASVELQTFALKVVVAGQNNAR
jgi:hypothetical protein